MAIIVVSESELRELVHLDEAALQAVEDGFSALATKDVAVPPIMRIDVHDQNGEVDVKSAYIPGGDRFAVKIASGFWENPRKYNLPSGSGQMVVISAKTGRCEAVLLDNGYLTDVRTALAGALAARHLARENVETAGQIGAGAQGRYQMEALKLVRDYQRVLIYDLDEERLDAYVAEMPAVLGVEVVKASSAEQVVRESDMVTTSTPSHEPFVKAEWLRPGLHITAMGSDAEHKQELFPEVLGAANLLVCDRKAQVFRLGEFHHAKDAGIVSEDDEVYELGELTAGQHPGRKNDEQVTVCDLTGVGVQDTAISVFAYDRAVAEGVGVEIEG
jgi:ornithine cyclodeaminase